MSDRLPELFDHELAILHRFENTPAAPEQLENDAERLRESFAGTGTPRCRRCGGIGTHGTVHVRHGNGGGHNEPCPEARGDVLEPNDPADGHGRPGWQTFAPHQYRRESLRVFPKGDGFVLTNSAGVRLATRATVQDAQLVGDRLLELVRPVRALIADEYLAGDGITMDTAERRAWLQLAHVTRDAHEQLRDGITDLLSVVEQLERHA